jgi:Rps23 Pro-64 3,4-dihydroxylase Tpa1-like proline 4-hydroxylase
LNEELIPANPELTDQIVPQENTLNLLQNTKALNLISKLADRYSRSDMVPQNYKGKPENCFVALELASRMDVSPVLVMQNLYIVQGKPSWAGQACKALIDGSGKFRESEYIMTGSLSDGTRGCYLQAVNTRTGKLIKGSEITLKMAQDEGWSTKAGSKWKTMPEQMLKYRAAAFFARTECPEVLMGFQTAEEVEDVRGVEPEQQKKITITMEGANA